MRLTGRLPVRFVAGAVLRTPARTLSEGDMAAIINASWESGPLHTDAEYARGTEFGRTILGGPCLVAIAAGLTSTTMYASWYAAGLDCRAALGIDEVRYHAPVFAGDTIRVESTVTTLEETPGGSGWHARVADRVLTQDDRLALSMSRAYLLTALTDVSESGG